jgi:Integral membrane protein CcmA involved in cell shape determination
MADQRDSLVNSIIGAGSAIDGDIDVDGLLRIDGDVRGSVRATGKVVVGAAGRVEAPIRAKSAIIGGIVKGDVYVSERLRVLSGGVVIGNVFAPRFEAEDGTLVHGDVAVTGRPEAADEDLAAFVRGHGDAKRFLGAFRETSFAPLPPEPEAPPAAPRKKRADASQPEKPSASAEPAAEATGEKPEPAMPAALPEAAQQQEPVDAAKMSPALAAEAAQAVASSSGSPAAPLDDEKAGEA